MENNILLISNDETVSKALREKLLFLRKDDAVVLSDYKEALSTQELTRAELIFVHESGSAQDTVELIKKLRVNNNLCIILLVNSYNKGLILAAYDNGADDFAFASADDFELVIRAVNNIKHNSIKLAALRNNKLLEQLKVIDDLTGLYNYSHAEQVIENVIDDNLLDSGVLVALAPSESAKSVFSVEKMAKAILASIRVDDVPTLGRGAKFYILLPKTDFNSAIVVLNKIKDNYDGNLDICAGISGIAHKSFSEMERDVLQALSDAVATNAEFVFAEEKNDDTLDEWLDDCSDQPKNYKIFRQIFNKKMEKVITPVFYRLQKTWEEKLFKTEIEQYTDGEQCVFHLKNEKQDSTLRIIYPGFAKIIIAQTHEGLDSPENKEIQLPLAKISQKELVVIVEDFIKDFKYTSV